MTGVSARYSLVPVAGDTVIIYITPENLSPLTLVKGAKLQNKYGTYLHDDMIGTPYGSKIYSKSATRGYVFMLAFTPELWTRSLPHRTQVLYAADISMVVLQLALRPGSVVVESGTGSGSLTTSLARAVAPHGAVHTYEFNAERAAQAQEEFDRHGFGQLVTVTHADAVAEGFAATPDGAADGVFLDLPQPWAALHHAWRVLRPCGAICSFSPCIEQVMRTCAALTKLGFDDIRTFETLQRPYNVTLVSSSGKTAHQRGLQTPDFSGAALAAHSKPAKRRRKDDVVESGAADTPAAAAAPVDESVAAVNAAAVGSVAPSNTVMASTAAVPAASADGADFEQVGQAGATTATAAAPSVAVASEGVHTLLTHPATVDLKDAQRVSVRPVVDIRGHTGYLTFAFLYNKRPSAASIRFGLTDTRLQLIDPAIGGDECEATVDPAVNGDASE